MSSVERTLRGALREAASRYGDAPWLSFGSELRTFAELERDVDAIAAGLLALGLDHGDAVGLCLGNRVEWLEVEYAAAGLGAPLVPINTWFRERELLHVLSRSRARILVWGSRAAGQDMLGVLRRLLPELDGGGPGDWRSSRLPDLRHVIGIGDRDWPTGVIPWGQLAGASDPPAARERRVAPDDVLLIMFTSGTTGAPKGAMIRHGGALDHVRLWAAHLGLGPDDRSIMASPLFWTFGCTLNAIVPLAAGSSIALLERFEARSFLETLTRQRCTHLQGVPTQYQLALDHPDIDAYDLSALRVVQIGGSSGAEDLAQRLRRRAPAARMVSAYGLTEGVAVNTWTELDDPLDVIGASVGHAAPDTAVELRDPATGTPVPPGEVGEVWLRGDYLMDGYVDDPEATASTLVDGALRTGDLAIADERGYLAIVGRRVDAYKRGGANVYPAEAEQLLLEHPAVRAIAIVGVPDERLGEVGAAFVVPACDGTLDAAALLEWAAPRLASYKLPQHVELVDELPLTPSGKVQKFKLRERWVQAAGGQPATSRAAAS